MIRGILLDLGKTLVNLEDYVDFCSALRDFRRIASTEGSTDRSVAAILPNVPTEYLSECAKEVTRLLVSLPRDLWDQFSRILSNYEVQGVALSKPMPHLDEFTQVLQRLRGMGAKTAVVTLFSKEAADLALRRYSIYVDAVIARKPGLRPKPYPDQVIEALKVLNVDPTLAVMIGDAEWDEEAALAAGVGFIAVTNGRRIHGFRKPLRIVNDLGEAAKQLLELLSSGKINHEQR
jgi:phosphoglycolate phosphatase